MFFKKNFLNYFSNYMLIPLMIMIIIFSCFLNDYLMIWFFMEINTMLFMTYFIMNENKKHKCLIYFFIQSIMALLLLNMLMLMNLNLHKFLLNMISLIINIIMLIKLGMPPFHQWYMNMIKNMNWLTIILLSTFQKFIPLILLKNFFLNNIINFEMILIMMLILNLMNEINLKKIMGYSSIYYTWWMMIMVNYNMIMFLIFFLMYLFLSILIMKKLNNNNITNLNDLIENKNMNYMNNMIFLIMSMFPPMLMFLIKWLFIMSLVSNNMILESIILMMISLMYLFIYLRMLMLSFLIQTIKKTIKYNILLYLFIYLNIISIILMKFYFSNINIF